MVPPLHRQLEEVHPGDAQDPLGHSVLRLHFFLRSAEHNASHTSIHVHVYEDFLILHP